MISQITQETEFTVQAHKSSLCLCLTAIPSRVTSKNNRGYTVEIRSNRQKEWKFEAEI